jgi:hypothetical protein
MFDHTFMLGEGSGDTSPSPHHSDVVSQRLLVAGTEHPTATIHPNPHSQTMRFFPKEKISLPPDLLISLFDLPIFRPSC